MPVTGTGAATKRARPSSSYLSTILPALRLADSSLETRTRSGGRAAAAERRSFHSLSAAAARATASAAASAAAMMHVLILAYILRKLPFTVRAVFTSVIQTPEELEEAARSLGARRMRVISRIVLPLTWRGVVAGLLLSAIYVLSEVSVSVTLGALNGDVYSPTHIGPITFAILQLIEMPRVSTVRLPGGRLLAVSSEAQAAALATMLMLIEVAVIMVSTRLARRGQALVTV